ncbi:serine/threonine protein kinase [Streptomyces sp. SID7958]|uniref:non-specific serine/threonine protein kinase n=2 Tax=unclassified Streptomyces TaxID=2593676 RepID=A0A6G3QPT5_9ACTN|nr:MULTISPECIES: serine/threonine-protein kinase [unclassified Streptomyces]NEA85508.1 serine/threonine protein kinase [Streptomyces sp. SID14436]NEC78622.1 serine/threonine protein kinase [Streptomyces sp. SID7958]
MSSNGGPRHGADDATSFDLQPPSPQPPAAVPHPGNPYAAPTQVVPSHGHDGSGARAQEHPPLPSQEHPPVPAPGAPVPAPGAPGAAPGDPRSAQQAPPPSSGASHEPGTGRVIAGRYRLLGKLGHGGMGTVWRAKDETVDREVAVKEPRVPDHLPDRERANAFERMRREARAAARLDHPAVVNVHDVAVVDGQPWIVMELVQGRSLGAVLQEEGTLSPREAARVGLEVLGALEAAHAAGILHRDVKPDNVMLGRHDRVVLTDFGIAQIEGETNLTDTGGFVGSPEYIAPERVLGQRPGPASDLWSLGVVLYAATEGVSPFRRSNTPATLQSVLNATPAAPATAQGPLAEVITALLDKDPSRRPNAARVRALLEAAANPPAPPPPTQVVQVPVPGSGGKGVRLGRKTLIGLGAAVVAGAVAAYLVIADPFAGPLPDGWKTREEKDLAVSLAVPQDYQRSVPDEKSRDTDHWVRYTDWSGSVWVGLNLDKKAEDTGNNIAGSADAEMYDDDAKFKDRGSYDLNMPSGPKTDPRPNLTYKGRKAAENTIVYSTDDSQNPRPRELRIFYYRSSAGDMYKLTVSYPGKGDFTERGREVAKTVIDNLEVDKL